MTQTARFSRTGLGLITVMSLAILAAGCAGTSRPKPAELPSLRPTVSLKTVWSRSVASAPSLSSGQGAFSPAVSAGLAVAAGSNGVVRAFDLNTGEERWSRDVKAALAAGVGTGGGNAEGLFAVVGRNGELILLDQTGKVRWRVATGGVTLERPVVSNGHVVLRFADNRLAGYDLDNGARRWLVPRSLPNLVLQGQSGLTGYASPTESNSHQPARTEVYAGLPGGRLMQVDTSTGRVTWEVQVAVPKGSNEVERIADLLGSPTLMADRVCVAAYQHQLACYSQAAGRSLWSRSADVVLPPGLGPTRLVAVESDGRILGLELADGKEAWQNKELLRRGLHAPVVLDNTVWLADAQGYLHGLSAEDGRLVGQQRLPGGRPSGLMRPTTSGLLVQTQGGSLVLLRP